MYYKVNSNAEFIGKMFIDREYSTAFYVIKFIKCEYKKELIKRYENGELCYNINKAITKLTKIKEEDTYMYLLLYYYLNN